jgi:hypothetical protein
MEKLFYDLSETEFTRGRKILLWIFCAIFFLAGCGIVFMNLVQHNRTIHVSVAIAPFGISIFVGIVAYLAVIKRKDHFFLIDDEKIEYRFGLFKAARHFHKWTDVKEIYFPHREAKILLKYKNGSHELVNLTWLGKKKTHFIRRHFFIAAREKHIDLKKVRSIPKV